MTGDTARLNALLHALVAVRPVSTDDDAQLAVTIYRRLREGQPVALDDLAAELDRTAASIDNTLTGWPGVFRDQAGAIVGFWGLTVLDLPPHRYQISDVVLSTWCAWDPLFLTPILNTTAQVDTLDALTGDPITLTVTPTGVTDTSHPAIVMSFLDPTGRFDSDIIERFCHYVHFFTDPHQRRTLVRQPTGNLPARPVGRVHPRPPLRRRVSEPGSALTGTPKAESSRRAAGRGHRGTGCDRRSLSASAPEHRHAPILVEGASFNVKPPGPPGLVIPAPSKMTYLGDWEHFARDRCKRHHDVESPLAPTLVPAPR